MIRLSDKDELVLACSQLNAELSVSEIARRTKLSHGMVGRSLSRLSDLGIVHKLWYVDIFKLGYRLYNVWFSVSPARAQLRANLVQFLRVSPAVVFFVETTGRFNFSLSVQTKSLHAFNTFIEELSDKFGSLFAEKSISTVVRLCDLPFIKCPKISGIRETIDIAIVENSIELDALDAKLLRELELDPHASMAKLAGAVRQGQSTVHFRLGRLSKVGVLAGCRYFIDFRKLGYSFMYHQVSFAGATGKNVRRLQEFLASYPSVYYFEVCIGPWDLEVGTVTRNSEEVTTFTRELFEKFGDMLHRIESTTVSRFIKLNGAPVKE